MNPIVEMAFGLMNKTDKGFAMDAVGVAGLTKVLHALIGKPSLEESIFDLWALAKYLEEQLASPSAAADIRNVVFSLKAPLSKAVGPRKSREPAQLSKATADLLGLRMSSLPSQKNEQTPGTKWWQVKVS